MGTYLPDTETLGLVMWCEARITSSRGIPPNFYPPLMGTGPLVPHLHASQHLAKPPHLNECGFFNLNEWLLDFQIAQFSDDSG